MHNGVEIRQGRYYIFGDKSIWNTYDVKDLEDTTIGRMRALFRFTFGDDNECVVAVLDETYSTLKYYRDRTCHK